MNSALLHSGAPIHDMNRVRSVMSQMGGGRLAVHAWPAPIVTLAISDVPGDDPATIASGPTVAPTSSPATARKVLERYGVTVPASVSAYLASQEAQPPSPEHPAFATGAFQLIASGSSALMAAAKVAEDAGIETLILGDAIEGEAREVGKVLAGIARSIRQGKTTVRRPCLVLSGGETSVTVTAPGRGGRNTEFLLSFALAIDGLDGIAAIACDTDGIDGSEDNAGAFCDGTLVRRLREAGLGAAGLLDANDAWSAFAAAEALFVTGPTGTNVNDFRAILVV